MKHLLSPNPSCVADGPMLLACNGGCCAMGRRFREQTGTFVSFYLRKRKQDRRKNAAQLPESCFISASL